MDLNSLVPHPTRNIRRSNFNPAGRCLSILARYIRPPHSSQIPALFATESRVRGKKLQLPELPNLAFPVEFVLNILSPEHERTVPKRIRTSSRQCVLINRFLRRGK
jgi:hypothetical protein